MVRTVPRRRVNYIAGREEKGSIDLKLIVFDLDGTLVDSGEDIARSVNELREQLGRPPLAHARIQSYVGNGVRKLLERSLGETEERELVRAEASYLSIYRRRLLETTRPYPGVVPALEALSRNRALAVLTNKPASESLRILEGLALRGYFRAVYGGDSFARKKPDPMGVRFLQEETGAGDDETLMVGDSTIDFETARNAMIRSCLVRYGMGPWNESEERPDYVVDDLRELQALLEAAG
jgi:phosphoglycolate phosphatase